MKIEICVDPTNAQFRKEFAKVVLKSQEFKEPYLLDLDFVPFLKFSDTTSGVALDFLYFSSVVYVVDKIVSRKNFEDNWTRDIELNVPISTPEKWNEVSKDIESILSFLSGDRWKLHFSKLECSLFRKTRKRKIKKVIESDIKFDGVSLFSGGLDSLMGTIDWLETNKEEKILLISHHDGNISGPGSVQKNLKDTLCQYYPGRIWHLQSRISHIPRQNNDHNYRCRSLLYMAMGIFAANTVSKNVYLQVPENGSISLNFPLSASRISSLSTRTVHPYYVEELNKLLRHLGIENSVVNPYSLKTKGEMALDCFNRGRDVFKETAPISVSCAKGRRSAINWKRKSAKACGRCLPCIYRRAALNKVNLDDIDPNYYGDQLLDIDLNSEKKASSDLKAIVSFVKRNKSKEEIRKTLLSTCKIKFNDLDKYANLVTRTISEVTELLVKSGVI